MNEKYWPGFYKDKEVARRSEFAYFCRNLIGRCNFLEVGAGDGRDTLFFNEVNELSIRKINYLAVIEPNNILEIDKVDHYQGTFEEYIDNGKCPPNRPSGGSCFDYIYARWFIHAVSEEVEDKLLEFAKEQKATLMLEFRILGDEPDDTHERRLIDLEKFTTKLLGIGFVIKHLEQGHGLSKVGDNDPLLARVIAEYNE